MNWGKICSMAMQTRLSIILIIITAISLFFHSDIKAGTPEQKELKANLGKINIDSITAVVKRHGWNNLLLEAYSNYLINSEISLSKEENLIASLPGYFQKSYLYALVLKKQGNFKTMYDTLNSAIDHYPNFFPFYDELVFSANANNFNSVLENKIERIKGIPVIYSNYALGLIKSSQGDYHSALDYFLKIIKRDSTKILPMYRLSYTYRNLGDYQKAFDILNSAVRYSNDDEWMLAKLYPAMGSLYFLSGKYEEAENYYKNTYDISSRIKDRQDEAKSFINLGIIEDMKGNSEEARSKFKEAVFISKAIKDFETEATALSELGVSYSFTNNLIEAKDSYVRSYNLFKKTNNRLRLALLSGNIGKIYMTIFDYKAALKYYNEGLEYSGENKRAKAINLIGIADVNSNLSNYASAIKYYKMAQKIASQIKEVSLSADIQIGLGVLSFDLGRYYFALNHFKRADTLSSSLGNPYLTADTFYKLGLTYFNIDSLNSAKNYFESAIDTASKYEDYYTEASALTDYAVFNLKNNEIKNALDLLDRENKISTKNGFTYLIGKEKLIRGDIFNDQNNLTSARDSYEEALKIGNELNEFNLQIDADYKLAKLSESSGLNSDAEMYYQKAVKIVEGVSYPLFETAQVQISYFASKYEIFDSYIQFLLNQNRFTEAFNVLDKSRSRNTMQNLNNIKLEDLINNNDELSKIYEYEWMIHSGIYSKKETDSIKTLYSGLKKFLTDRNPELKDYLNMREFYSLSEIRKKLQDDENIISIYSSDKNTVIFLITKNSFKHYQINLTKQQILNHLTRISPYFNDSSDIAKSYYNQDLFAFNTKAAYELYTKLLKPVLTAIPHNDKLIFSPSLEFVSFPFEFLVTSFNNKESPYNYSNKHFLIFDYDISYTPSAGMYIEQKENKLPNDNKVLIVGDPVIKTKVSGFAERRGLLDDAPGIPRNIALLPLKYSEDEIDRIGSIIRADKILVLNNATETNFKKNAPLSKLIHLSTHSILHNKQPVIFFSNANDPYNDGFLEASEVAGLKLNSDLVVLSSCNSGLGLADESEGVVGMAKAFFEAGTKSVVISLWEVNDKYTSIFMGLFYEYLSKGLNKSEALRQAKISFIKNYSANPYYWGAFVLTGNTSTMRLNPGIKTLPYLLVLLLVIFSSAFVIIFRNIKIQKAS